MPSLRSVFGGKAPPVRIREGVPMYRPTTTHRDFVSGFQKLPSLPEPAEHWDEADRFSVHLNCCKGEITREKGSCGSISTFAQAKES